MNRQQGRTEADDGPGKTGRRRGRRDCDSEGSPRDTSGRWRRSPTSVSGDGDNAPAEPVADLRLEGDRTGAEFELAVDLPFVLTVAEEALRGALDADHELDYGHLE